MNVLSFCGQKELFFEPSINCEEFAYAERNESAFHLCKLLLLFIMIIMEREVRQMIETNPKIKKLSRGTVGISRGTVGISRGTVGITRKVAGDIQRLKADVKSIKTDINYIKKSI